MIFIIELKRRMTNISIFGIIMDKFYYKKKPCPFILFKIDKSLKVGFYCTILPFVLTICLWMESNKESLLNSKEIV